MREKDLSVYIHIPFCIKKCHYCDFTSFDNYSDKIEQYIEVLINEISSFDFSLYKIKSIFFGGGTPSLLKREQVEKILNCIPLTKNIEITMECNPETLSKKYLKDLYEIGINRLSIGLQSIDNNVLKTIGRVHTYSTFLQNYEYAREVGFNNINIDLMFSLPNLSKEKYLKDLEKVATLKAEHLSIYSLIVEEGTKFDFMLENNEIEIWSEDDDREVFEKTEDILRKYNYNKYEISNYCKKDMECTHNLGYWELREYIGFGLSAHSFINNERFENVSNLEKYLCDDDTKINITKLTNQNLMEEFVFLGLRKNKGISAKQFEEKFNCSIYSIYGDVIYKLQLENSLTVQGDIIKLSKTAINISNKVLSEFLLS